MKRRTKIATILTTGLLSAALVGVGFAAWTITTGKDDPAAQTGTVTADKVTVSGLDYTVQATNNEAKLGKKDTTSPGSPWLDDTDMEEDLELAITITLNYGSFQKIDLTKVMTEYDGLVTSGYLKAPVFSLDESSGGLTSDTVSVDGSTGNITFTAGHYEASETKTIVVKVTLGWGARFDGKNPYDFFNAKPYGTLMSAYDVEAYSSGDYSSDGAKMNYVYAEEALGEIKTQVSTGITASFTYKATAYTG